LPNHLQSGIGQSSWPSPSPFLTLSTSLGCQLAIYLGHDCFSIRLPNIPRLEMGRENSLNVWHLPKYVPLIVRCLWRGVQGQLWPCCPPSCSNSIVRPFLWFFFAGHGGGRNDVLSKNAQMRRSPKVGNV